jgi:hypothetical protein
MLDEGYLRRDGDRKRPVLALTARGREAAETASVDVVRPRRGRADAVSHATPTPRAAPPVPAPHNAKTHGMATHDVPPSTSAATSPGVELDRLIGRALAAERDEAKDLVGILRFYHPQEVARRLEAWYDVSREDRERSRAVWVAGEVCGEVAVAMLIPRLTSQSANVRRLAASALGKIAATLKGASDKRARHHAAARSALEGLAAGDPDPQVQENAAKALAEFA